MWHLPCLPQYLYICDMCKEQICGNPFFRPVQVFFKMFLRALLILHCLLKVSEQCRLQDKVIYIHPFPLKHRQFLWSMTGKYTRKHQTRKTCKKFNDSRKRDTTFPTNCNRSRQLVSHAVFVLSMVLVTIKFIIKRLKTAVNFESSFILVVSFL